MDDHQHSPAEIANAFNRLAKSFRSIEAALTSTDMAARVFTGARYIRASEDGGIVVVKAIAAGLLPMPVWDGNFLDIYRDAPTSLWGIIRAGHVPEFTGNIVGFPPTPGDNDRLAQEVAAMGLPSAVASNVGLSDNANASAIAADHLAGMVEAAGSPPAKGKTRARRRPPAEAKALTPRQVEVLHVWAECKGNFADAGRRLGIARKTVQECVAAAQKKLGKKAVKQTTKSLPKDRRQQESAAEDRRR